MVCLLDRFMVTVDGVDCRAPRGSAPVLAVLALEGAATRGRLAGMLWPNSTEARALANLRTALWRLRQLGLDVVEEETAALSLEPAVIVDYRTKRDPAALMADLLPQWDEPWLTLHQARWRQVRLHALDQVCADLLAGRDWPAARSTAEMIVRQHPCRETSVRHLVSACLHQGDAAGASHAIERFRCALGTTLNAAPSPQLEALAAVALAGATVV